MSKFTMKMVTMKILGIILALSCLNAGLDWGYFGRFDNKVACAFALVCYVFYRFFRPNDRDRELYEKRKDHARRG